MYVILICAVLFVIALIASKKLDYCSLWMPVSVGMTLASGIPLCGLLVGVWACRTDAYTLLAQRDALQRSYQTLRANPLEMASAGPRIAQWNAALARAKYWNKTQWDWYWPDEVETTEEIR